MAEGGCAAVWSPGFRQRNPRPARLARAGVSESPPRARFPVALGASGSLRVGSFVAPRGAAGRGAEHHRNAVVRPPGRRRPDRAVARRNRRGATGTAGGVRGPKRAGPTRSHPEPGRDPAQRRKVLRGRPRGRRGRRGRRPPPSSLTARRPARPASSARGGAAAARWAHNPKVGGSNPPPATTVKPPLVHMDERRFLLSVNRRGDVR
jgi:hypothetical protein